jgi:hypothetical protein
VPLHGTAVSTVSSFGKTTKAQTQASSTPAPAQQHHANVGLYGLSIALCVIAIIMFWVTSRSAKTTTI